MRWTGNVLDIPIGLGWVYVTNDTFLITALYHGRATVALLSLLLFLVLMLWFEVPLALDGPSSFIDRPLLI
jgi:hypothetical protein